MRKIVALLFSVSYALSFSAIAAESDVDAKAREEKNMPPAWFTCESSYDCTLIGYIPCSSWIAVNKYHDYDAGKAICGHQNCYGRCDGSTINRSYAVCDQGQCVTKSGTLKEKADAELDAVYKKLMSDSSPASQTKLRETEDAWTAYRTKQCEFDGLRAAWDPGLVIMVQEECYTSITKQRMDTLTLEINCDEGNSSSGISACGKKW